MTYVSRTLNTFLLIGVAALTAASALAEPVSSPNPFLASKDPTAERTLSRDELRAPEAVREYTIELPDGRILRFKDFEVTRNNGVRTIKATSGKNRLLLTTDGRRGYGYVLTDDQHFRIDTNGRKTIIVDSRALPNPSEIIETIVNDAVENFQAGRLSSETGAAQAAMDGPYVVDIAFFYDGAIAQSEGLQAPRTYAQSAVDYTNAAFATHAIDLELRLVYVGELSTPLETNDPFSTYLGDTDRAAIRDEFGADLGHYIYNYRPGHGYCGKAYLPGWSGVSAIECGIDTIAHEIGHNFGMNHNRAWASTTYLPYSAFNYGYWCGGYATLMTYNFGSPQVPFYSSPLQSFGGEACGVENGEPGAAHNARVAQYTKSSTAAYKPEQTTYGDVAITSIGPLQVIEGLASEVVVEITRTGDLTAETSVEIGAIGIEATAGADYADIAERVEFLSGESVKQVAFAIFNDENYEPTIEKFEIVIRYPKGLTLSNPSILVEITSDDPDRGLASFPFWYEYVDEGVGEVEIDVNRIGSSVEPLTVQFETADYTAVAGVDYIATSGVVSFAAGETTSTITIPVIDDDLFEGLTNKRFNVNLVGDNIDLANNTYRVYVENDDLYRGQLRLSSDAYFVMENGSSVDITIERINGTEDSHRFWLYSSEGSALHYVDFVITSTGTSVWDGATSKVITYTSIIDNAVADGERYFNLELDPQWESAEPVNARVYIVDDEAATEGGGTLNVGAATLVEGEGAAFANVSIERVGGTSGAAIVSYSTASNSAIAGEDFGSVSGTVGWIDGDASNKIIQIPIVDDAINETDETFIFSISNAGGALLGANVVTEVTIRDNEGPGELTFDTSEYTMSEDGWVDVAVSRQFGSNGPVSVSYNTLGGTATSGLDFQEEQGVLDWLDGASDTQFVRLYGVGDELFEFKERFQLQLSAPTGGATLGPTTSTTVVINTNDVPNYAQVFGDIPESHWAWLYVHRLAESGITSGCGNNNYCPGSVVTRAQMAVFLERGMNGSSYVPAAPTGNVFDDVATDDFAASFIEQLAADGITSGCGGNNYCPNDAVKREQMAVFLLKAKYGLGYSPPPATGVFADVVPGHWSERWIEAFSAEGITAGCGGNNYCPKDSVTRDQMAVFLVRAFGL